MTYREPYEDPTPSRREKFLEWWNQNRSDVGITSAIIMVCITIIAIVFCIEHSHDNAVEAFHSTLPLRQESAFQWMDSMQITGNVMCHKHIATCDVVQDGLPPYRIVCGVSSCQLASP